MNEMELALSKLVRDEGTFNLLKLILSMKTKAPAKLAVDFAQINLINSNEFKKFDTLKPFILRFNGLCELVSNCVIANDLLGSYDQLSAQLITHRELFKVNPLNDSTIQLIQNVLSTKATNPYQANLTLTEIDKFSKSHTLDVYSYFQKMVAYLLNVYPFDLFSFKDNIQINKKVNQPVLKTKLESLEEGSYIKFMTFKKGLFSFQGHAMVIKKTGNNYSFFDPNKGEYPSLSAHEIGDKVNESMQEWGATHMAFLDGKKHIQSLHDTSRLNKSATKQHHKNHDQITQFILTEIKRISDLTNLSDDDLVRAMDGLRNGVERLMEKPTATIGLTNDTYAAPDVFNDEVEKRNFRDLDQLRVQSKIASWGRVHPCGDRFPFTFNEALKNKTIVQISSLDDIIVSSRSANSEEFKLLLKTASLGSLIQSSYELAALFSILDEKSVDIICGELHDHLLKIMPSSRHFSTVMNQVKNSPDKVALVYNAMKLSLPAFITSASDVADVFEHLSAKEKEDFYERMSGGLHETLSLIKSANDYSKILRHLTQNRRMEVSSAMSAAALSEVIKSARGVTSFEDACLILSVLSLEQSVAFFKEMSEGLLFLMNKSSSRIEMNTLSQEKQAILTDAICASLPTFIQLAGGMKISNFVSILNFLLPEQGAIFCAAMKESKFPLLNPTAHDLVYILNELPLIKSKMVLDIMKKEWIEMLLSETNPLDVIIQLPSDKRAVVYVMMKDELPALIKTLFHLKTILKSSSPEQCTVLCEAMKNQLSNFTVSHDDISLHMLHMTGPDVVRKRVMFELIQRQLPSIIKSVDDLAIVLADLTPAQSRVICNAIKNKLPRMIKSEKDIDVLKHYQLSADQYKIICGALGKAGQKWIEPLLSQSLEKFEIQHASNHYKNRLPRLVEPEPLPVSGKNSK